jgi:type IV secretion system protein VirD4
MTKTRRYWAGGLLVVSLLVGYALSGYFTLHLLGVSDAPLTVGTYFDYIRALSLGLAKYQPYAWKIKLGGAFGFGLPLLLWFVSLYFILKRRKQSMHGDARFATAADLRKQKMLSPAPNGILVGKYKGNLVRLPGQQFVILAAPTRSGKGVGVVIPNLLDYQESVVVLDIKQENFDLTSGWRKSQGQEIYLFNPFAEDRRTHRWNPLSYVSKDPAFRVSDLMSIASMLYPDVSDDQKFWVSQARNAFMAFSLYLCEKWEDDE